MSVKKERLSRGTPLEQVSGIGPAVAKRLREHGIPTAEFLARSSQKDMWELKIGEATLQKIIGNARMLLGYGPIQAIEVEKAGTLKSVFSTGLNKLDRALLGGFRRGTIVELYGPSRGAKTILSSQLAVRAKMSQEQGGLDGRVLWLDTQSSFNHLTVRTIAERFDMEGETTLQNIIVQRILNLDHLLQVLQEIPHMCIERDVRLIVIDSLGGLFAIDYDDLGVQEYLNRTLSTTLKTLRAVTEAIDGVCLVTNTVFSKIGMYGGNPNSPMCGHAMAHGTDYHIFLRRLRKEQRKVTIQKAPGLPEYDGELYVGWGGLFENKKILAEVKPRALSVVAEFYPDDPEVKEVAEV